MRKLICTFTTWLFIISTFPAWSQTNGKLQIHFMDVGQGDGALLISPLGETVLFDTGVRNDCDRQVAYMSQLGITKTDYLIVSHYHDDHIGCVVKLLETAPLAKLSFDRGDVHFHKKPSKTYSNYVAFVGSKRKAAIEDSVLWLDKDSANPVKIEFVALNGNGVDTRDENDESLVCVVRFGQFDAVLGGDLSGMSTSKYRDVESTVATKVGQVEVYKVNHHGSQYSSNTNWLGALRPKVGVISCGNGNEYFHPTAQALGRLHSYNIVTYWTERGNGAIPGTNDKVGGNIIVEAAPQNTSFTVRYNWTHTDNYDVWNPVHSGPDAIAQQFAWSSKSEVYHLATCRFVQNIDPANLKTSSTAPTNHRLHLGCPK